MSLDARSLVERFPASVDDAVLLGALPLGAAIAVYVAYLLGHPYPAYGAGLFLEMAERVAANGYRLPARVEGYTAEGVPFAYPPLAFYGLALLVDGAGLDSIAVVRVLPGLLVVAYLVPYAGIAVELTDTPRRAALATVLLSTTPAVLQWHLSAGGVVRAPAFLFALASIYAGVRLFRTHAPRWAAAGAVAFGLAILTHPTYALFVVLSYLLCYAALDRSVEGLAWGAVVGFGGLALALPWLLHVAAVHGVGVLATAAGSHGGIGAGPRTIWTLLVDPLYGGGVQWPFYVLAYLGALYALRTRRWLLPAWALVGTLVVPDGRFLFVPGSILSAAFVLERLAPAVRHRSPTPTFGRSAEAGRSVSVAVVGVVVLAAVGAGTLYAGGAVAGVRGDGAALPSFVDAADEDAMAWTARNTPPDATVVALGDAAEWLPFLANRTILIGPWGTEWQRPGAYYVQYERFASISTCERAACLARSLEAADVSPDYVYVPKGHYTVFDEAFVRGSSMPESLEASTDFRVVYENEGVVIAAVVDGGSAPRRHQPADLERRQHR